MWLFLWFLFSNKGCRKNPQQFHFFKYQSTNLAGPLTPKSKATWLWWPYLGKMASWNKMQKTNCHLCFNSKQMFDTHGFLAPRLRTLDRVDCLPIDMRRTFFPQMRSPISRYSIGLCLYFFYQTLFAGIIKIGHEATSRLAILPPSNETFIL